MPTSVSEFNTLHFIYYIKNWNCWKTIIILLMVN